MNAEASAGSGSPAPEPSPPPVAEPGGEGLPSPFRGLTYLIASGVMGVLTYGFFKTQRVVGVGYFKLAIAGLLGAAMVLAGPLFALSVYFGTTFAGSMVIPGIPLSVNQAVGLGVLAAWGLWLVAGRTSWPGGGYLWLLVVASLYYLANSVLGEDPEAGLQFAKYIALYELLGFVLLTSLRRPAHWTFWFWMVLLVTSLNSFVGVLEFVTRMDYFPGGRWTAIPLRPVRVNGLSQNAIMYGYNSLWAFGPGLYLALQDRVPWRRGFAGAITAFILAAALLAFNRQTPINMFLMLSTGAFLLRHRWVRPLSVLLVIAALLASPLVVVKMGERFTHAGELVKDTSYAVRRDKVRIMKEMVRQKPFFGVGLGSFPAVWPNYLPENLWFLSQQKPRIHYPDMGYMQMMSESGIVGFLLDLLILGAGGMTLWRRRRRALETGNVAVVNLCGVLVMLVVQLVLKQFLQDVFFFPRSWWLFAMIVVVAANPDERLVEGTFPPGDEEAPEPARAGLAVAGQSLSAPPEAESP